MSLRKIGRFAGTVLAVSVFVATPSGASPYARVAPYQLAGATFGFCDPFTTGSDMYVAQIYRQAKVDTVPSAGVPESYAVIHFVSEDGVCVRESGDIRPSSEASTWELANDGSGGNVVGPTNHGLLEMSWSRLSEDLEPFYGLIASPEELITAPPGSQRVVVGLSYPALATGSIGAVVVDQEDGEAHLVPVGFDTGTSGNL
jgi:hypothetical protein